MDLNRFKECSAAFGAERRRWPQRDHALYDRFAGYAGRHGDPRRGRAAPTAFSMRSSLPRRTRAARAASPRWPGPPGAASARRRQPWRRARLLGFVVGFLQVAAAPPTPTSPRNSCSGRKACRRSGCDRLAAQHPRAHRAARRVAGVRTSSSAACSPGASRAGRTQGSQTRRSIQAMLAPLPDAKRELVRREIDTAMPRVREQFAALQKARAALAEEMVKPTPDSGRARARLRRRAGAHDGDRDRVAAGHRARTASPHAGRAPRHGAGAGAPPERRRAAAALALQLVFCRLLTLSATMIRRSWTRAASIDETLALWAASLREIKKRIRPLFGQERVATNAGLFLRGPLGDEQRKTGRVRAEAPGDPGPWRQQAILGPGIGMLMPCAIL